jgi:hypothetical protein
MWNPVAVLWLPYDISGSYIIRLLADVSFKLLIKTIIHSQVKHSASSSEIDTLGGGEFISGIRPSLYSRDCCRSTSSKLRTCYARTYDVLHDNTVSELAESQRKAIQSPPRFHATLEE